jgi:hypothetical protein
MTYGEAEVVGVSRPDLPGHIDKSKSGYVVHVKCPYCLHNHSYWIGDLRVGVEPQFKTAPCEAEALAPRSLKFTIKSTDLPETTGNRYSAFGIGAR